MAKLCIGGFLVCFFMATFVLWPCWSFVFRFSQSVIILIIEDYLVSYQRFVFRIYMCDFYVQCYILHTYVLHTNYKSDSNTTNYFHDNFRFRIIFPIKSRGLIDVYAMRLSTCKCQTVNSNIRLLLLWQLSCLSVVIVNL